MTDNGTSYTIISNDYCYILEGLCCTSIPETNNIHISYINKSLFYWCLTPSIAGTPCNINVICTLLKSTFGGLQLRPVATSQICKITQNSDKIRIYSSARSSKVIDLGVNRKRICDFLLSLIVTLDVYPTVFEILLLKVIKWPVFPTPPLFDAHNEGNASEFVDARTWTHNTLMER